MEAGFRFRGIVGGSFDYSVAAFLADVEGELIPFEVASEPGRTFFRNAGSSKHQGIELGAGIDLPLGFDFVGAYTLADYTFTEFRTETDTLDGNTIPGIPKHRAHLSLRYTSPQGVWAALDYNYSSSLTTNDANSAFADSWMTTNLRVGWDVRVGRTTLRPFVSVLNVFDESYVGSVVVNAFGGRFFEPALDVSNGGVLWALPALLANGLLRHTKQNYSLPKGFYSLAQIFVLLAFMALDRIRSIEQLRYAPPGEYGKLLGLDRIPEVRTLRKKI